MIWNIVCLLMFHIFFIWDCFISFVVVFYFHLVPVFPFCFFPSPTCLCLFSSLPASFVLSDEWILRLKSLAHPSWRRRVMFGLKWVTRKKKKKLITNIFLWEAHYFFPLCCAGFVIASFGAARFFFFFFVLLSVTRVEGLAASFVQDEQPRKLLA